MVNQDEARAKHPARERMLRRLYAVDRANARLFRMLARRASARGPHVLLDRLAFHCDQRLNVIRQHMEGGLPPKRLSVLLALCLLRVLFWGLALRIMERRLQRQSRRYSRLEREHALMPGAVDAVDADAEKLGAFLGDSDADTFMSAVVLGLNDALVEMTGALAGFTMVLQNNRLIMLAGFTTGIAATLSMAASEFFSQKAAADGGQPRLAATYTGIAYLVTVLLLLLPYTLCPEPLAALGACMVIACLIILVFTWVDSLLRGTSFWRGFLQMAGISFGVALAIFLLSWLVRAWLGIEI